MQFITGFYVHIFRTLWSQSLSQQQFWSHPPAVKSHGQDAKLSFGVKSTEFYAGYINQL
jgi:hypothetical protein